ncbi:MAG TPA: putative maltokinase [Pirellulales bacterium]|nr:putative maltokinase [Pirellulales bacterium]
MAELANGSESRLPRVTLEGSERPWDELLGAARNEFAAALDQAIGSQRWFGAKSRKRRGLRIVEAIPLAEKARLLLVEVQYESGSSDVYQLPLALAEADGTGVEPSARWIEVQIPSGSLLLYDPLGQDDFAQKLLAIIASERVIEGQAGQLAGSRTDRFEQCRGSEKRLAAKLLGAEQSNSSITFDGRLVLKVFRRVERGLNPDLEITGYLTARGFKHIAPLAGFLEYRLRGDSSWSLAVLQKYVPNRGDAWTYYLQAVTDFVRRQISQSGAAKAEVRSSAEIPAAARAPLPQEVRETFAEFIPRVERLAERTAELHIALSSSTHDPAFTPESFTPADHRRCRESAAALLREAFELLGRHLDDFKPDVRKRPEALLSAAPHFEERNASTEPPEVEVAKTRCHGDYHLGQVLVTDDDYVIIDFEGEPARPLEERRQKQLALRDVAGMLRSFHYVGCTVAASMADHRDARNIERITAGWYFWMSAVFVSAYRRAAAGGVFLPATDEQFDTILSVCLLEKAAYELKYELNHRPDWIYLPVTALGELLRTTAAPGE